MSEIEGTGKKSPPPPPFLKFNCVWGPTCLSREIRVPLYDLQIGHPAVVQEFIDRGVNIEVMSSEQCRPLFIAAQYGHTEVVKLLIAAGAEIEWKCEGHYTSL